jgi:hypothetical protein
MKTDDLIDLLAQDSASTWCLRSVLALAISCGIIVAAVLFFAGIGFRPDISEALTSSRFLFKCVVATTLAITATRAVFGLGRPDASLDGRSLALALAPALLAGAVAVELAVVPERQWMPRLIGHDASKCLILVPLLSIGPLSCLLAALRRGAPSSPGLAGAVAGLSAGGIAAAFYTWNCADDSPLFVITWYSLAILIVTSVGYLAGRKLLRW